MKSLINIAAVVCAFALHAAPQVTALFNGDNFVNTPGEIVGVQCMTIDGSQAVTASVEIAVTEYTNAYKTVNVPHTRYDFTITNYDGSAAIATNVLDNFNYSDWKIGTTNLIIGAVKPVATNIATQVADGKRPGATYTKELVIGSGTASSHYLLITPSSTMNFYGGNVKVNCADGDRIIILVK